MAERTCLSPGEHDLFDGFFFGSSPEAPATTRPTPQSMTTGLVLPSENLSNEYETQDFRAFNSMIAQFDIEQLEKLSKLPARKRNELFSDYKSLGEQGISKIIKELEKVS